MDSINPQVVQAIAEAQTRGIASLVRAYSRNGIPVDETPTALSYKLFTYSVQGLPSASKNQTISDWLASIPDYKYITDTHPESMGWILLAYGSITASLQAGASIDVYLVNPDTHNTSDVDIGPADNLGARSANEHLWSGVASGDGVSAIRPYFKGVVFAYLLSPSA